MPSEPMHSIAAAAKNRFLIEERSMMLRASSVKAFDNRFLPKKVASNDIHDHSENFAKQAGS